MTDLPPRTKITKVQVAEIRTQELGASPGIRGRFVLMSEGGQQLAHVVNHVYTSRTMKLLDALYDSMEADLVSILEADPGDRDSPTFSDYDMDVEPHA